MTRHITNKFELNSVPFNEESPIAPEFEHFFNLQILPMLAFDGYKIEVKRRVALHCLHNVSVAALRKPNKVVADNRTSSNRLRVSVWNVLIKAGLCRIWKKGYFNTPGSVDNRQTQYRATKRLLRFLRLYKHRKYIDPNYDFNSKQEKPTHNAHFVFHTGKTDPLTGKRLPKDEQKKLIPLHTLEPEIREFAAKFERRNAACNETMGKHEWRLEQPGELIYEPNYAQHLTSSGYVGGWMRLSGRSLLGIGQLSKAERKHLVIDGEPATELDFGAFDITRYYHYHDIDIQGDAYRPEIVLPEWYASDEARSKKARGIMRKLIKKITNVCLNCANRYVAFHTTRKTLHSLSDKPRRFLWGWEDEDQMVWRALQEHEGLGQDCYVADDFVRRILCAHVGIRGAFFGVRAPLMMSMGAAIMDEVRTCFVLKNKPCFCIHDSIVCRQSDREFARSVMIDAYHQWVKPEFDPIINVEF